MSRANAEGTERSRDDLPWYRRWFGEAYLEAYPHRDEAEADDAVDLLLREIALGPGARLLDLACGEGRHMRSLGRRGLRPVGLDLSSSLLRRARDREPEAPLVRADMRDLPFRPGTFGVVTSFFTSFGYFSSDEDDRRVLVEIRRVLEPGGHLFLDFLNAPKVRETLSPRDEDELNGKRIVQERRLVEGGRAVEKTIRIDGTGTGEPEVFHERVRLYSPEELAGLLTRHGLEPERWFGDYEGGALGPAAPRAIVLATASAA